MATPDEDRHPWSKPRISPCDGFESDFQLGVASAVRVYLDEVAGIRQAVAVKTAPSPPLPHWKVGKPGTTDSGPE
jgi:hypothetical protein